MSFAYDSGVLIAADRGDRDTWVDHRRRLEAGILPLTTAPVVAQSSRSSSQARLRRFLAGCEVVAFGPESAHPVGELLAKARASDVVDAHLVLVASATGSTVLTSDGGDLLKLSQALAAPVRIRTP